MASNVYDTSDLTELLTKITAPDCDSETVMNTYVKWAATYDQVLLLLI